MVLDGIAVRYLQNGVLDGSYGVGGTASTAPVEYPYAARLQPDGKIVVMGLAESRELALARLDATGAPDASFGAGGGVITTVAPGVMFGFGAYAPPALAIAPDGKIVVGIAGTVGSTVITALVRYDAAGALDASFGSGGILLDSSAERIDPTAIVVLADGTTVLAGGTYPPQGGYTTALARYDATGTLDPTFGVAGRSLVYFTTFTGSYNNFAVALVRQPDGMLVAAVSGIHMSSFALARVDADGVLDPTFGNGGTLFGVGGPYPVALIRQADGRLVVAGALRSPVLRYGVRLARYLPDGTLDDGFGIAGVANGQYGDAYGATADPDERIVVTGDGQGATVARFLTAGPAHPHCDFSLPDPTSPCDDGNPCTAEYCDGPPTLACLYAPNGFASCDVDGNECSVGQCGPDGQCHESFPGPVPCSDDGDPCTLDRCDVVFPSAPPAVACTHRADFDPLCSAPLTAGGASLSMHDAPGTSRGDRIRFRWSHGTASKSDFGAPRTDTSYRFCAFQYAAGPTSIELTPFVRARVDASSTCTADGCWIERQHGWKLQSRTGAPDGIAQLVLSEGRGSGRARIDVKAAGPSLLMPTLPRPDPRPVIAQLHSSDGKCWGASFSTWLRNSEHDFNARSQ
jgi:uncharacterized delta-60 repeat protein